MPFPLPVTWADSMQPGSPSCPHITCPGIRKVHLQQAMHALSQKYTTASSQEQKKLSLLIKWRLRRHLVLPHTPAVTGSTGNMPEQSRGAYQSPGMFYYLVQINDQLPGSLPQELHVIRMLAGAEVKADFLHERASRSSIWLQLLT